ncbi:MAG: PilZ domain-containing protein [Pseudomonadota bacterium]
MRLYEDIFHPYKLASLEDRCVPRIKLKIMAKLRYKGERPFSVLVTDLSIAGFRCETVSGTRPPATCWLTLPGLASLLSEVAWNDGYQIGCAFSDLLDQAVLDHILATTGHALTD